MLETSTIDNMKRMIMGRAACDRVLLDEVCDEIRPLRGEVRKIQKRSVTAVSLVASDGGNNKLAFDPFYVQLVRVTDSYGKELCLDVVSPTTNSDDLSRQQFNDDGSPRTALGKMMKDLGVRLLHDLSPMIPDGEKMRKYPNEIKPGWVLVYRDLCEWAVLYERIVYDSFASNTLIVRDGQLRSKLFSRDLFIKWRRNVEDAINKIYQRDRRKVFLVGLAKHSKVIDRYRLAMAIENIFPPGEPWFVRVPRSLEKKAYLWDEYARGVETEGEEIEAPKFVAGDMHLVRFGRRAGDPIWAVDTFSNQSHDAQEIFGYLLNDAIDGFPIPFYPLCLQKAHEHAQIVDFDLVIFQDQIYSAIRDMLPIGKRSVVDSMRFQSDMSARRYE